MTDTPQNRTDPPTPSAGGFDFNHPTVVSLLYLASCVSGVPAIVGLVLAYVWRGDEPEAWEVSHYTYLIRTFWVGLLGVFVGLLLTVVLIGIPLLIAVGVWFVVRGVLSLVRAQKREPMPDPETWWI